MSTIYELAKSPDVLLALEPEEVALLVLKAIIEQEERHSSGHPHRYSFSLSFRNDSKEVQRAVMEAWAWLESSGAIAQSPGMEEGWYFATRRGHRLAASSDTAVFTREQTLPRQLLHPRIENEVWSAFLRGKYDSAVFEAFKQVEVAVREAGGYADSEIGVALARKAFNPDSGPLTNLSVVPAERQALSDLVAGALGSYKNPHSHRNVTIRDATEAAEMIILASHLLKIVDARRAGNWVTQDPKDC